MAGEAGKRPSKLFRNIGAKIASIPMILTALGCVDKIDSQIT